MNNYSNIQKQPAEPPLQRFGRFFIKSNAKGKYFEVEKEIKSSTDTYNKEFQKNLWESSILSTLLLIQPTLYQFHSELSIVLKFVYFFVFRWSLRHPVFIVTTDGACDIPIYRDNNYQLPTTM
jgi:hypothetical protein